MDSKIIKFIIFIFFISFKAYAVEFNGKFTQGHFILGKTDPEAKIIIDKKKLKFQKMVILLLVLVKIENLTLL